MEKYAEQIVVPLRSARTERFTQRAAHWAQRSRLTAFNSPDCWELEPNRREVRIKPKQHRAVVGFIVVLWAILFKFTCPAAYPSWKHTESVKRLASEASSACEFADFSRF